MSEQREDISVFEKHGQTLLAALVLAGILFIADKTVEATQNIAVMKVEIAHINTTLKGVSSNIYTVTQANSDLALRDLHIQVIADKATGLDNRLAKLEN